MRCTKEQIEQQKRERVGVIRKNNQGCEMKVIEYIDSKHIKIEFQDDFKEIRHATWQQFQHGEIENPHIKSLHRKGIVYEIGNVGEKYPTCIKRKKVKEYILWTKMLERCYDNKLKERCPTYKDITCCKEWLSYENFYEWVHSQENWNALLEYDKKFSLDKDILVKGNKTYSPNTCCLVPENVNSLFIKRNAARGKYPIGVSKSHNIFVAQWSDNKGNKYRTTHETIEDAFASYKAEKEKVIKQVAQEEFDKGNITKKCYEAMINYEVEITD